MSVRYEMLFLGAGNATAADLGNSSVVLLADGQPLLGIDYGFTAHGAWMRAFGPPQAVFITHTHLDHIGGLEALFYELATGPAPTSLVRLYCPVGLVALLHARIATLPSALAEGGRNFWDVFQLVPVGESFWHDHHSFRVFSNRHMMPNQSFGLSLPGRFFYSGDTRPIPEWTMALASQGEPIFHDAALAGNPAHSGLEDISREYTDEQRRRMVLYHLESEAACRAAEASGFRVARPGDVFDLGHHVPARASAATSSAPCPEVGDPPVSALDR
ncbi:MAG: MBL fold metallo-hydrolase [Oceanococcaceae bacterium]